MGSIIETLRLKPLPSTLLLKSSQPNFQTLHPSQKTCSIFTQIYSCMASLLDCTQTSKRVHVSIRTDIHPRCRQDGAQHPAQRLELAICLHHHLEMRGFLITSRLSNRKDQPSMSRGLAPLQSRNPGAWRTWKSVQS